MASRFVKSSRPAVVVSATAHAAVNPAPSVATETGTPVRPAFDNDRHVIRRDPIR
jgi:hypothetical protein